MVIPTSECIEELEFLVRSPTRVHILTALDQDGPVDRATLRDRFDCDRTTLQRNLTALAEHGWIQQDNHTVRITQAGHLVTTGLSECLDTTATAVKLNSFLQWIPDDAFDFDIELLTDAEITVNDSNHLDRILSKHIETLQTAERFRGFIPFIGRHSLETVWRRVTSGDGMFEVVMPEEDVDDLEPRYAEMFDDLLASDRIDILVTRDDIPYYLGIIDGNVQIGNKTDDGTRRALLETENDMVREWAVDTYEEYQERASLLEQRAGSDTERAF